MSAVGALDYEYRTGVIDQKDSDAIPLIVNYDAAALEDTTFALRSVG